MRRIPAYTLACMIALILPSVATAEPEADCQFYRSQSWAPQHHGNVDDPFYNLGALCDQVHDTIDDPNASSDRKDMAREIRDELDRYKQDVITGVSRDFAAKQAQTEIYDRERFINFGLGKTALLLRLRGTDISAMESVWFADTLMLF